MCDDCYLEHLDRKNMIWQEMAAAMHACCCVRAERRLARSMSQCQLNSLYDGSSSCLGITLETSKWNAIVSHVNIVCRLQ